MCAPRRGLAPPGVCHCALISYRIQRNKYHNPKQQWGNAMAVTPTPITKMTFGWYMIYDTTMTGREKYPYVIAIRETLPWSENSKTPGMKKIKPPSSRLGTFPMTDGKSSHGRFAVIPPAPHVPSRGPRAWSGTCLSMTQEHPKNAPGFSKNGNIFSLSVSRMEWRIYAAWHRASGFSYAARPLLRVRRVRALASSP